MNDPWDWGEPQKTTAPLAAQIPNAGPGGGSVQYVQDKPDPTMQALDTALTGRVVNYGIDKAASGMENVWDAGVAGYKTAAAATPLNVETVSGIGMKAAPLAGDSLSIATPAAGMKIGTLAPSLTGAAAGTAEAAATTGLTGTLTAGATGAGTVGAGLTGAASAAAPAALAALGPVAAAGLGMYALGKMKGGK